MSETLPNPEQEQLPVIQPESGELLDVLQDQGEKRGRQASEIKLNDVGIDKASRELFDSIRRQHIMDSESTPNLELSEEQKRELINSLIQATERDIDRGTDDPNAAIEKLAKILPGS